MNNFTKEELQTIEYCIDNFMQTITNDEIENKCINVLIKIQSLVDNYCDPKKCNHEWVSLFVIEEEKLRVLGGTGYKCLKCEKIVPSEWGINA